MAGKESAEMKHARELITTGPRAKRKTPTEAAQIAGCARITIYRAQWYKDYKASEAERAAKGAAK